MCHASVLPWGSPCFSLAVVADLPALSHHSFWRVRLAEHLGDQTLPEVIVAHLVTQFDRVGVHAPSPLTSKQGYSTPVGTLPDSGSRCHQNQMALIPETFSTACGPDRRRAGSRLRRRSYLSPASRRRTRYQT